MKHERRPGRKVSTRRPPTIVPNPSRFEKRGGRPWGGGHQRARREPEAGHEGPTGDEEA
jgi:hypothetical protein